MDLRQVVIWVAAGCVYGAGGGLLAASSDREDWVAPVVQEVSVPQEISDGVFYPAHEEMVIIRPGAWRRAPERPPVLPSATMTSGEKRVVPAVNTTRLITLTGRIRLSEALGMIAAAAGKNIILGQGVADTEVTLDIRRLPVSQALKVILYPLECGYTINGGELMVLARDTRVFRIDLPPLTQSFDTATTNESSSSGSGALAGTAGAPARGHVRVGARVNVHHSAEALSYWNDVEAGVRNLVSKDGVISCNKAAGVVIVTDTPRRLDILDGFIRDMNTRAVRQIMVDVKVVEVELSKEYKLGIDWGILMARGELKGMRAATNFASENMADGNVMTFSGRLGKGADGDAASGIKAMLKALESFGRIDVVSQPRVMMLNNSVASIQVGETRAYVESTNVETTSGGSMITSAALNEVHGGVTLQIVGTIAGDDVVLGVTPVVTSIDGIRTIALGGGSKLEAPDTSIKTMSTLVRVREGQTVAIGGLITRDQRKEEQGIPFLSRVPLVGKLFSYEVRRNRRTELVIFMTPHRG
ncbi:MAG: hypothetical protein WCI27_04880 [Candidatus Omnitrophota bacterium]